MMAPVNQAIKNHGTYATASWNQKGSGGVMIANGGGTNWIGLANRIEFRTIRYQNIQQYGTTLEMLYYLTRGLLSGERTPAHAIYKEFDNWLVNYQGVHELPDMDDIVPGQRAAPIDFDTFRDYMQPYADHAATGNTSELKTKTKQTVQRLRELFGMSHLPSNFN